MIRLEEVSKSFGSTVAVDKVSFELQKGQILGFMGPNGAGKTTTMRLITGYLSPDQGQVLIGDLEVAREPVKAKQLIGYLPEDNPLYTYLTPREYLNFIADSRQVPLDERFDHLIEVCGIKRVLDRRISELSKGYRQRVGLAAAMIHDPPILILDEPTSGLDPNQIVEIRGLIKELGKEKTVILSTHILSEVELTCDWAIIIDKGKLVARGTVDELTEDAAKSLEEVFRELTLSPKGEENV